MTTCLCWILGYMRLEICAKSACLETDVFAQRYTQSQRCMLYYWIGLSYPWAVPLDKLAQESARRYLKTSLCCITKYNRRKCTEYLQPIIIICMSDCIQNPVAQTGTRKAAIGYIANFRLLPSKSTSNRPIPSSELSTRRSYNHSCSSDNYSDVQRINPPSIQTNI